MVGGGLQAWQATLHFDRFEQPDPAQAISDADSQIPLGEFALLVERCLAVWRAVRS